MQIIDSDIRERSRVIDRSIETTLDALQEPATIAMLGDTSRYVDMLSHTVFANVGNGHIGLPQDYIDNTTSLLVATVRDEEEVMMLPSLDTQTDKQRTATIKEFVRLGASRSDAEQYSERYLSQGDKCMPLPLHPLTRAMAGMFASFDDLSDPALSAFLPKAPTPGYLQVNKRPAIVVRMASNKKQVGADVISHEVTHARQYEDRPVSIVRSQRSIDMRDLRDELEAYHVGAVLGLIERGVPKVELDQNGKVDLSELQYIVDSVRRSHGVDPLDPYRPSPHLLAKYGSFGLDIILHQRLDFSVLQGLFEPSDES